MKIDIAGKIDTIKECMKKVEFMKEKTLVWDVFQKDLSLRLSWNSNSLEGNTLSLDETVAIIEYDEVRSGHTYTEYQEAKSMYQAVSGKLSYGEKIPLNLEWIQSVNAIIMYGEGEFRTENVYIGSLAEAVYYPPEYSKVPELMSAFETNLMVGGNMPEREFISFVAKKHMEFERIHPFKDGNGRCGRMIMNQQLLNYGMLPAIIKDQSKYRQAFRYYERNEDLTLMEYVIADGILETYDKLEQLYQKYMDSVGE